MHSYPLFVNLADKHCLVVGAGGVGRRKIKSLIDAGAGHITVLETCSASPDLESIQQSEIVDFQCRNFCDDDVEGKFLVIACTSDTRVNRHISDLCNRKEILCNIADQPERSSFIVPASVRRGDLTIAISTDGQSPAMAKCIRKELQDCFGDEYAYLLTLMGKIRPLILDLGLETQENTAIFRSLVNSELLASLKSHDLDAAAEILKEFLPEPLCANIPELFDGLI